MASLYHSICIAFLTDFSYYQYNLLIIVYKSKQMKLYTYSWQVRQPRCVLNN